MVSIVTEVWALAGCGPASKAAAVAVAAQELPAQHPSPAAAGAGGGKAKKRAVPVSFRGVSSGGGQDHQREAAVVVGRRRGLASCALAAVAASFSARAGRPARALVLEEDDDIELLERVKEDRKKRLQKQGIISSSGAETGLVTSHELQPLALFFSSSSSSSCLHLRLDKKTSEALLSSSNRKPCCGLIRKTHRVFAGPHLQAQQSRAGH
jgi:hypothetical protein